MREEATNRIDDIGQRTFDMRKELDGTLESMKASGEIMQARVEERTQRLEEQSSQVSTNLIKWERAINSKVAAEELSRVQRSFAEQLQECRNVLQAQMTVVRERAEKSFCDIQHVVRTMESVSMRSEVEPIAVLAEHLRQEVLELNSSLGTKAEEDQVADRLEDILAEQAEQKDILCLKADSSVVQEQHESHVGETSKTLNGLQEAAEHLGISINSVEEQVAQVAGIASAKAERTDVDEMMRMNESVQEQVAALKAELQGTLKALETWILEQNGRKASGMGHESERQHTRDAAAVAAKHEPEHEPEHVRPRKHSHSTRARSNGALWPVPRW